MTGPGIYSYSTTPANNVQANTGINWDEGMSPAAVNNSARQNMTDMRNFANNPEWFKYGKGDLDYSPVYASSTTFTVAGIDVTTIYTVGRRVKAVGSSTGTIYGTISATAFSTNTTVTVVWDSGSLSNETLTISIGPAIANYPVGCMKLPTRQILTSGSSATYTTPPGARQLRVRMVGGGGGGGGANATPGYVSGSNGVASSFNSIGAAGGTGADQNGGAGGTGGTGSANLRIHGGPGLSGIQVPDTNPTNPPCGVGGSTPLGYPSAPTNTGGDGSAASANTGAGGNGAINGSTHLNSAGGGGGGEYVELIINSPAATYTYTVGAGGAGGSSTRTGGAGGSGLIIVDEIY